VQANLTLFILELTLSNDPLINAENDDILIDDEDLEFYLSELEK